jgi:hypothetical protein
LEYLSSVEVSTGLNLQKEKKKSQGFFKRLLKKPQISDDTDEGPIPPIQTLSKNQKNLCPPLLKSEESG